MPRYYEIKRKGRLALRLNADTVRRLLYSREVEGVLTQKAEQIKANCGSNYVVETMRGHDRVRAIVKTGDDSAAADNLDNNTLLKAVGK